MGSRLRASVDDSGAITWISTKSKDQGMEERINTIEDVLTDIEKTIVKQQHQLDNLLERITQVKQVVDSQNLRIENILEYTKDAIHYTDLDVPPGHKIVALTRKLNNNEQKF